MSTPEERITNLGAAIAAPAVPASAPGPPQVKTEAPSPVPAQVQGEPRPTTETPQTTAPVVAEPKKDGVKERIGELTRKFREEERAREDLVSQLAQYGVQDVNQLPEIVKAAGSYGVLAQMIQNPDPSALMALLAQFNPQVYQKISPVLSGSPQVQPQVGSPAVEQVDESLMTPTERYLNQRLQQEQAERKRIADQLSQVTGYVQNFDKARADAEEARQTQARESQYLRVVDSLSDQVKLPPEKNADGSVNSDGMIARRALRYEMQEILYKQEPRLLAALEAGDPRAFSEVPRVMAKAAQNLWGLPQSPASPSSQAPPVPVSPTAPVRPAVPIEASPKPSQGFDIDEAQRMFAETVKARRSAAG